MSDADLEYGPTPAGAGYEHTDVAPAVAYNFALWLGVAMVVSVAIVYGTFRFLEGRAVTTDDSARRYPLAVGRAEDPPAPRLQTQPFRDVYDLKSAQRDVLNGYGWIDRANGVVHIPIERAMQLTLERGLPTRSDPHDHVDDDGGAGRFVRPDVGVAIGRSGTSCNASASRRSSPHWSCRARCRLSAQPSAPGLRPEPAAPASQTPVPLQQVRFDQRLDARLPLDATFKDEDGRQVALGEYFGSRPVVLASSTTSARCSAPRSSTGW